MERHAESIMQKEPHMHVSCGVINAQTTQFSSRKIFQSVLLRIFRYETYPHSFSESWIEHEMRAFNWILIVVSAESNTNISDFV